MSYKHLASKPVTCSYEASIKYSAANICSKAKDLLSLSALVLCALSALVVVANQIPLTTTLDPFFRSSLPTLCLAVGFLTALSSLRLGIMCTLFLLPLLPDLTWQIQQHLGYGRIFASHAAGLDLIAGLLLGSIARQRRGGNLKGLSRCFPWPAGAVLVMITASVALAIIRNLHQTSSPFYVSAFIHSLLDLRALGWHDDYRPLTDWAAYACACSLIAVLVPVLSKMSNRNEVVLIPLIASLTIAAIVGVRQSIFGFGLSADQMNFRLNQFGFMALGFQPDIHAFAGQMLIGAVGLFGYLYYKKSIWWRFILLTFVIPLCWFALFLSKSKASLGIAICLGLSIPVIWFYRHSKRLRSILIVLIVALTSIALSAVVFTETWYLLLTKVTQHLGIKDLATLNIKLSYRPEVYLAALNMLSLYPLLGLGQGEFYHQAANHDLTNSYFLSLEQNGENAHNYFLQVLVENGLIGFLVFVFLLAYPLWKIKNKRTLVPACVALGAIFAGNIFSHSMLVRENMFIAASLVALMYAWLYSEQKQDKILATNTLEHSTKASTFIAKLQTKSAVIAITLVLGALVTKEIYAAFKSGPFLTDIQCQKTRALEPDGWTSGQYQIVDVPPGSHGVTINLATTQPDIAKHPLKGTFTLFFNEMLVAKQGFELNRNGPQKLSFDFPANIRATPDDYRVDLNLQRCFVPKNFGMGADSRRLGVKIESLDWHY